MSCIDRNTVCVPRGCGDDVDFSLFDEDGDEFDTAPYTSIVFRVTNGVVRNGRLAISGEVVFQKSLGAGVTKLSNGYQIRVAISDADTDLLQKVHNYYELTGVIGGVTKVISAGPFISEFTVTSVI